MKNLAALMRAVLMLISIVAVGCSWAITGGAIVGAVWLLCHSSWRWVGLSIVYCGASIILQGAGAFGALGIASVAGKVLRPRATSAVVLLLWYVVAGALAGWWLSVCVSHGQQAPQLWWAHMLLGGGVAMFAGTSVAPQERMEDAMRMLRCNSAVQGATAVATICLVFHGTGFAWIAFVGLLAVGYLLQVVVDDAHMVETAQAM